MKDLDFKLGFALLISGLGVIYLSRFLLRKHPKMTGNDLKNLDLSLEGIHQTYLVLNTVTVLSFAFFLFLIYQSNKTFWEERVLVLFVPVFVVFALFDGIFALRTKVFPTTTRYNWNSYVYDGEEKLRWVAYWQIGLAVVLLVADYVLYVLMS
jgi:hypothetical protein